MTKTTTMHTKQPTTFYDVDYDAEGLNMTVAANGALLRRKSQKMTVKFHRGMCLQDILPSYHNNTIDTNLSSNL